VDLVDDAIQTARAACFAGLRRRGDDPHENVHAFLIRTAWCAAKAECKKMTHGMSLPYQYWKEVHQGTRRAIVKHEVPDWDEARGSAFFGTSEQDHSWIDREHATSTLDMLLTRAALTPAQADTMRRKRAGDSERDIAADRGCSHQAIHQQYQKAAKQCVAVARVLG
jgi:DNA-directed RNA polymerase specialized sigma24 family protein